MKVISEEQACDEIYQCAGIRFWRVADREELTPALIVSDELKAKIQAAEEEGL